MAGFSEHPGTFCHKNPSPQQPYPCGDGKKFHMIQLQSKTAGISTSLYNGEPLKKPRYVYFVLYHQPKARDSFKLASFNLIVSIKNDNNYYHQWIDEGKPVPNTKKTPRLTIAPIPKNGQITIKNTLNDKIKNCPSQCNENFPLSTEITLITNPFNEDYVFSHWTGYCQVKKNEHNVQLSIEKITSTFIFQIEKDKQCSAIFKAINRSMVNVDIKIIEGKGTIISYKKKYL
jgi:hypothetical protein